MQSFQMVRQEYILMLSALLYRPELVSLMGVLCLLVRLTLAV
jgi:hypothetical protein